MTLLFRALNEYDIACNPLVNGLASKKMIYDMTMLYLLENEKIFMSKLNGKEKDEYCKQNMIKYINNHQYKLKDIIDICGSDVTKSLSKIEYYDVESWTYLLYYLSSLNTHLYNGSRLNTDWISTSKNLNSVLKYYKNQSIHKIAVLATCSNGVVDNKTVVVDMSSKEIINDILFLIPKKISQDSVLEFINKVKTSSVSFLDFVVDNVFTHTNENFVGFNYATRDSEVCIYRFYPSDNVISVLEQLQIDLITFNYFNFDYLMLDKERQILELNKLKEVLKKIIINEKDYYMLHVFNEMYLENKNIDLVKDNIFKKEKINYNRIKILKLARNIHNIQIKR